MEYYEYHYIVKDLAEYVKKENEAQKGQQDQAGSAMGNMKVPNIKVPKMSVPKF
jgi:sortase (surface protein transpeptidase)